MKNNDDLFQLIKTLNKEEKQFFRLYASRVSTKGDSNYVRLFNAIDKQEEYDEKAIRKQFAGQSIEKFLASSKHELYGVILKSLHAKSEEESPEAKLRMLLHYAEVLAVKGHEEQARNTVHEARQLAETHELLTYLPEILHLEFSYMPGDDKEQQLKRASAFYEEHQQVMRKLENRALYERLDKQVRFLTQNLAYGHSNNKDAISSFLEKPEIADEKNPLTVMARYYFHHIRALCAFNLRNFEETYNQSKLVFELSQQHAPILQHDAARYISLLHHYSNACSVTGRMEEMKEVCRRIRQVQTNDERLKARAFQYSTNAEFNIYLAEANFDAVEKLAQRVEEELPQYRQHMERVFVLIICGQTAYSWFLLEQHNKALKWLNEALNLVQVNHRDDITLMLRLLEVLLHFELGNHDLVDYRLKALIRYISPRADRFKTEAIFIQGIRKITTANSREQLHQILRNVKAAIDNETGGDAYEKQMKAHLNLNIWLNGKLSGVPMRELRKQNEAETKKRVAE